jgi:dUTP pyrophosphatase
MIPTLCITKTRDDAVIPTKAHESDAGYDLTILSIYKTISPSLKLYDTGIKVAPNYPLVYTEIYARSSLMKMGYMLANNVGIIDNSYRGPLLVALWKFDETCEDLKLPCKVAQLIPRLSIETEVVEVSELDKTKRGEGGFGSTGV